MLELLMWRPLNSSWTRQGLVGVWMDTRCHASSWSPPLKNPGRWEMDSTCQMWGVASSSVVWRMCSRAADFSHPNKKKKSGRSSGGIGEIMHLVQERCFQQLFAQLRRFKVGFSVRLRARCPPPPPLRLMTWTVEQWRAAVFELELLP